MNTVHVWLARATTVRAWGQDIQVPQLVEDEDGIRVLLVDRGPIPLELIEEGFQSGAQAIVCAPLGAFLLAEYLDELTERADRDLCVDDETWVYLPEHTAELPTYVELELLGRRGGRFVNLHTHTEFSSLDGLATVEENAERALADKQTALAISDHGVCSGHPALQAAANKHGFKPIFGMEAYFVDDRFSREDAAQYWHLCLWAMDNEGLQNLWAASTESFRDGFYRYPRMDWDTLERFNTGLIASTGCLRGPVAHELVSDNPDRPADPDRALANLSRLHAIFGDRFYVELHTNQLPIQREVNTRLVELARTHRLPMIAVADSHYAAPEDKHVHDTWVSVQLNKTVGDDSTMFADHPDLHLHTHDEAMAALAYLGEDVAAESVAETVRLAERCSARIEANPHVPVYSRVSEKWPDPIEHDVDRLLSSCRSNWAKRTEGKRDDQNVYLNRFAREFDLIVSKGFAGYFLMVAEQVNYAKSNNVLVGPGRGSGGGSLVAYLAGITEIDPVEHELLFERFMTEGRTALPDFDIDYPSSRKQFMLDFVRERWGSDRVVIVGTHMRLKNKGAINKTAQAIKPTLPPEYFTDLSEVSKLITEAEASSAGLGISWDALWNEHEEVLEPYRAKYPELFRLAGALHLRLNAYGRHPAGVVISPDTSIEDSLPLRLGEEGSAMVTQFDMAAMENLGYVKFDFLNVRALDVLQHASELIERDFGQRLTFDHWTTEYSDPMVFENISAGWTKGIFQIETTSGTRMCKRFQPQDLKELADVITLVRPGPMNSGLTEEYLRRRAGESEVSYDDPRLEQVLAKTYGLMIYQEDIMATCMVLADYNSNEADAVRKILGKKQVQKVAAEGQKFVSRAVKNGTDPMVADTLWKNMAEFARYSFNRAHAFAYAMLGYWTAWTKVHFPVQQTCALLSNVDNDRIGDFVDEARRLGIAVQPPDINESGHGFSSTRDGVRYGLDSIKGVGGIAVDAIIDSRPYSGYDDFIERRSTKCNMGAVRILARIGAFDSLVPNRRGLMAYIDAQETKGAARCRWLAPSDPQDIGLPCAFDWANEPVAYGRPGKRSPAKPLPPKPLPKRCSRACRQFDPEPPPDPATVTPFSDADIADIETELLGIRFSTSEFQRIPEEVRQQMATAEDVMVGPRGSYSLACLIRSVRRKNDRYGRPMAWLNLMTESGAIDGVVVFSSDLHTYENVITDRGLVLVVIEKGDRGPRFVHAIAAH